MKKSNYISRGLKRASVLLILTVALRSSKSYGQKITGNGTEGDTVTYILYNNELSFDSKRTLVFDDKHSVDSLVKVLAASSAKHYKIIYQKEGKQAMVVASKFLQTLDKSGIYRLTIAYNRPNVADDDKPLYIIRSK